MFRLWAKMICKNKLIKDMVVCNENDAMHRTKKIFTALDEICLAFDLPKPIWLDVTIEDFKRYGKTRFGQDNFIEHISFDYLEIQVIQEA